MSDGMERDVRVFLVDDHAVVLDGLSELLDGVPGLDVVGTATSVAQALARIPAATPDVAVLDVRLPDGNGVELCREVRAALPQTYCLMLTSYDDHDAVLASVLAGASGYVLKEVRTAGLVDAIQQVALGRSLIDPAVIAARDGPGPRDDPDRRPAHRADPSRARGARPGHGRTDQPADR